MSTPLKELGEIYHTVQLHTVTPMRLGQTVRGRFSDNDSTYFGEVKYATADDAVVEIISHTSPSDFRKGQRVHFLFNRTRTA